MSLGAGIACGTLQFGCGSGSSSASRSIPVRLLPQQDFQLMADVALQQMLQYDIPGMSVAITSDDVLIYAAGFGVANQSTQTPVSTSNVFRIASNTKSITATVVYRLIESGTIQLTDKVFGPGSILGTTYGPYPSPVMGITVDDLLTHTAGGWQNNGDDPMFNYLGLNQHELIAYTVQNVPLQYAPGQHYLYSNFGYCILGRVIEALTKMTYGNAAYSLVLNPCGITDMFIGSSSPGPNEVTYYDQDNPVVDPYTQPVSRLDSVGGWVGTATDLVSFMAYVDGIAVVPDILPSTLIAQMTAPSQVEIQDNANYAKGWSVYSSGIPGVGNNGDLPGSISTMLRLPSGLSWAVLTNARNTTKWGFGDLNNIVVNMLKSVGMWSS
jgi:D-alanyl-D-alanine carboxypeptidase